ncbi:MAG: SRPBCC family protein [Lapillicoccus sp.]
MTDTTKAATIEADPILPVIRITRDFQATVEQLYRAHTDPALFVRWVGPDGLTTTVDRWDATTGGSWRYVAAREGMEGRGGAQGTDGAEFAFHGCFHEVRPDRIVQTFTWEGEPDSVALETLVFEDLGDGRTRLRTQSLCDSLEARDGWLRSGMQVGVDQGYAKLDALLATSATTPTTTTDGAPA